MVLKALRACHTVLLAVLNSFLTTEIPGRAGRRLRCFFSQYSGSPNGLLVANILRPGTSGAASLSGTEAVNKTLDPWGLLRTWCLMPSSSPS